MTNDESAIDRELREALDVTPSPEFVARVRARIASEPKRPAWHLPWTFAVAGAGALAIVVAVLVLRPHEQLPPHAAAPGAPAPEAVVSKAEPDSLILRSDDRAPSVGAHGMSPAVSRAVVSPANDEPAVLVSPAEMRGLRRLIALANQGEPDLELLLAPPSDPAPIFAIEPVEIVIAPITIEPLAPDTY